MADPYVAEMPSVMIGAVEFQCHFRSAALKPTDKMVNVETFCDPGGERPSTTSWVAEFETVQSFAASGAAWNQLRALAKTKQTIVILPADGVAVSATNPSATCTAWLPSIPFIDGAIGEPTVFTLSCKVVGQPVFATT